MAIRVMPPAWAAPRPAGFTPRAAIGDRGRSARNRSNKTNPMIIVPPQSEEEFEEEQTEKIVCDQIEYSIIDLQTDQVNGGKFTAVGMNFHKENRLDWRIMPEDRVIFIVSSGSKGSDTECNFEYRS
jgi:hypothetical protein